MSNPPRILMAINIGALLAGLGHTSACYSFWCLVTLLVLFEVQE
jgi:hypothetical protein